MTRRSLVPGLRITFSVGVAERAALASAHVAIERTDQAMYLAKAAGRGRTMVHGRDGA